MSKSIKLQDNVYHELQDFTKKKETFSEAIKRLLLMYRDVVAAIMGRRSHD